MSVARSYAAALFEAATETKTSNQEMLTLEQNLEQFANLLEKSKELQVALISPVASSRDKAAIASELAKRGGFSPLLTNYLILLARKGRMSLIPEVREAFASIRLKAEGAVPGRLKSAEPLENSEIETIAQAFEKKLGKRVAFRTETDPSLLAGVKVTVNGVTYDGTLRSQLERLRDQLVYGASSAQ